MGRKEKERERENHTTDCGERQEESETLAVTFATNNSSMVIAVGSIPGPPHSNRQTNTQTEADRQTQRKPTEIFRVFPLVLEFITSFQSKEEILRLKLKIYNFL